MNMFLSEEILSGENEDTSEEAFEAIFEEIDAIEDLEENDIILSEGFKDAVKKKLQDRLDKKNAGAGDDDKLRSKVPGRCSKVISNINRHLKGSDSKTQSLKKKFIDLAKKARVMGMSKGKAKSAMKMLDRVEGRVDRLANA